jgi:DNA-binding NtrC family response regulator
VTIALPPLRARAEDIPLLTAHLVRKHAERMGRTVPTLTPAAAQALAGYRWPGNVRELENALQRALALCRGDAIDVGDLPEAIGAGSRLPALPAAGAEELAWTDSLGLADARRLLNERFEHDYLVRLLRATGGNISEAARRAGVDRSNLRRLMNRVGLRAQDYGG